MSWRERFNMSGPPLPRGVAGDTFFEGDPNFQRLARVFAWLAAEPGIGVVTGEPGVGKTAAMRHLCRSLPPHEHRIVYLSDTTVKPLDIYRMLAAELGLRPGPRAQIVGDIKRALVTLVDERGVVPIIILDDAQALRDEVLHELHGLTSLDFDGRDWSRRIIAAIVHERECGELAAAMVENACMSSTGSDNITWLHSDNGAPMKSVTLLATLQRLGISPSFSRPRVSNDNPYSESLFRTLKYRPSYPSRPFANLNAATTWVERFVHWYNTQHLHSAIRFVTPDDRHARRDIPILAKRRSVYAAARARHPERWTGPTRNWEPVLAVCLNPERSSRPSQSMASRD